MDLTYQPLQRGDVLVICSDGLSGQVKREEIGALVRESPDLVTLCSRLIDLANSRGGPDNITTVAARFDGPGLAEPGTAAPVGHQTYALSEDESTTEPVPVYTGSPAPQPLDTRQPRAWVVLTGALLLFAIVLYLALR